MSESTRPCGGCGATNESKRCIGCFHDFNSGQHAANDPIRPDLREYYSATLTMKHPSNRSKDNGKVPSRNDR